MALLGLDLFFHFLNPILHYIKLHTQSVGNLGDLSARRNAATYTQNKPTQISMP
jgi:hypothetical protein